MDVPKRTRRSLFSIIACAVIYAVYRIAAHNGWIIVTRGVRNSPDSVAPVSSDPSDEISLLLVGDTGLASPQRTNVVRMMSKTAADLQLDGVMLLGDNFYETGVQSVSDTRFRTDFELLFDNAEFDCPFYAALGNHDHQGVAVAQVQYTSHSRRWRMPAPYYRVSFATDSTSLDFFVLDTEPIHAGDSTLATQLNWLDHELATSRAHWKIVAGHHPCLSGGEHGASEEVHRNLGPMLQRHGVALYVSGHEHDLQLLNSGKGWFQLISGSGSKLRSTCWIESTAFAAASPGFAWLMLQQDRLLVSLFSEDSRLFTKAIPNPVSPVAHAERGRELVAGRIARALCTASPCSP